MLTRLLSVTSAILVLAACPSALFSQPPLPEQMESDLAGPFAVQPMRPELNYRGPISQRLEQLMFLQGRYLVSTLRAWDQDERALLLTPGDSREHGIRPNAHTAWGLAVLSRYVPEGHPPDLSPAVCRETAIAILRFILPTHGAGGVLCTDEKPWRNQWQSALWACLAGRASWLLWDELDPELRWLAARMICEEADRFVDKTPPAQIKDDTKAEENLWNSRVISLAANMFPNHPRQALWQETAIRWLISSMARTADLESDEVYDGRPLREWLSGANLHDDYTMENHDRVHPDYMTTIDGSLYQRQLYEWAGRRPPDATKFNTVEIYRNLKRMAFPDAAHVYPNGQDWHLHRQPDWIALHAMMAVLFEDPQAARLLRMTLDTVERMAARQPAGGIHMPGHYFFPSTPHIPLSWYGKSYLWLRQHGEGVEPIDEQQLWTDLSGLHLFTAGKFGLLRTPEAISTFSWGRQVMGMVLPLQPDLLLGPSERSLIGVVGLEGLRREAPVVRRVEIASLPDALGVAGILDRAGGGIEQRFGYLALPDGRTMYVDTVRSAGAAGRVSLDLGTLAVLNQPDWVYSDNRRQVYHEHGLETFTPAGDDPPSPHPFDSRWYNIDNALGIVCLKTSGRQVYIPNRTFRRGRIEQLFHLNHHDAMDVAAADASQPLAVTALVFYPGQTRAPTQAAARAARVETNAAADSFTIHLEDGIRVVFDLDELHVTKFTPALRNATLGREN